MAIDLTCIQVLNLHNLCIDQASLNKECLPVTLINTVHVNLPWHNVLRYLSERLSILSCCSEGWKQVRACQVK